MPAAARALATLSSVDYEDGFLVDARPGGERSGEEWARAPLEGVPRDAFDQCPRRDSNPRRAA